MIDLPARRIGRPAAGESAVDAGKQRSGAIRLDHVIVRADVHAHDLVKLAVRRSQHDDGDVAFLANRSADFVAVRAGKRKVEQDAVGGGSQSLGRGVRKRLAAKALVALELQHAHKIFPQRDIVFDNKQTRHQSPFASIG